MDKVDLIEYELKLLGIPYNPRSLFDDEDSVFYIRGNYKSDVLPLGSMKSIGIRDLYIYDRANIPFMSFSEFDQLTSITITNCTFTEIPPELFDTPNLQKLVIKNTNLTHLPEYVTVKSNQFHTLSIKGTSIKILPDWIFKIKELTEISLISNNIETISTEIINLKKLTKLWLMGNPIKYIPELPSSITELVLGDTSEEFPHIRNLQSLEYLDLSNGELTSLPDWISELSNLKQLDCNDNKLIKLPELPPSLETLNLDDNKLKKIELNQLPNLQKLLLSDNNIEEISDFSSLVSLKKLDLSNNKIKILPDFSAMANLEELNLSCNKIKVLPILSSQVKLWDLNLSNNQIKMVPEVTQLKSLMNLNLENNQITELPKGITKLPKIYNINVKNNQVSCLPPPEEWFPEIAVEINAEKNKLMDYENKIYFTYRFVVSWNDNPVQFLREIEFKGEMRSSLVNLYNDESLMYDG
ncbi:MAG: leucine-rich repeat domain-containing protein [Candidatus Heimdallarchaeota archaeon]|nr:leucine-rich repeat domain-containing protein [Candidatus Heimdallarchaeota archaeon]